MKPKSIHEAVLLALLVSMHPLPAFVPGNSTPSFDKRRDALPELQISAARQQAAAELEMRLSDVKIDYDRLTGTPAWISRMGFLSKPTQQEIQRAGDLGIDRNDPHRAIKAFLVENAALFEHGPEVLTNATITREFVSAHNGMRTVIWQQHLDGIPVFETLLKGHITQDGRLVNIASHFLPEIETAANMDRSRRLELALATPISATQALVIASADIGEQISLDDITSTGAPPAAPKRKQIFTAAPLLGDASAELVWVPMSRSSVRLCWRVLFMSRSLSEGFQTVVDATSGEVLVRHNRTKHFTPATYKVYTSDSPRPGTPGWPAPITFEFPQVEREVVTLAALSQTASPQGWIRDNDNSTPGPNVVASVKLLTDPPTPPLPPPQGSPFRVFDFPLSLSADPSAYGDAAAVNLFYWCNWMHDKLYDLGFTAAAGNFQEDDPVIAYAQYGTNDAGFTTWPDGTSPLMFMSRWTAPNPHRDGALAAEVILHEYAHGLSDRWVGGGVTIPTNQEQPAGLSEGWSDFYALALLSKPTDNVNGSYPIGGYVAYQWYGFSHNYYYGVRRYPYTHDMTKNPLTFKDIDPLQRDNCASGAPYSPLIVSIWSGPCLDTPADEWHSVGEVWCVTLWEARRNMMGKYPPSIANLIMLQLVTDGMNLGPLFPTFIQARDAILQADIVNNCGENWFELWAAFMKRGMGWLASAPPSTTTSGVAESFDAPPCAPNPCQD